MNIVLPPAQQQWLETQVAKGEDAVQRMIAERMALEGDDFAWVRTYLDEGRAAAERGEVITLDDHETRMGDFLKTLKR